MVSGLWCGIEVQLFGECMYLKFENVQHCLMFKFAISLLSLLYADDLWLLPGVGTSSVRIASTHFLVSW